MSAKGILKNLGAFGCEKRQEHDFYATHPSVVEMLMDLETFDKNIWEPACGAGHISEVLKKHDYNVRSSDLIDRGYGDVADFLDINNVEWNGDIITNPPYKIADEFIEKSLSIIPPGHKVAMLLKMLFVEGKKRKALYLTNPPKTIWVSSSRIECAKNGNFNGGKSTMCFAWYIWEKGFKGNTTLKWFN